MLVVSRMSVFSQTWNQLTLLVQQISASYSRKLHNQENVHPQSEPDRIVISILLIQELMESSLAMKVCYFKYPRHDITKEYPSI